jgi:hypothetical protein
MRIKRVVNAGRVVALTADFGEERKLVKVMSGEKNIWKRAERVLYVTRTSSRVVVVGSSSLA